MEELRQWKRITCPGSLTLTREKQELWLNETPRFTGPGRAGRTCWRPPWEKLQVKWQACPQGESRPINHTQRRRAQRSPRTSLH